MLEAVSKRDRELRSSGWKRMFTVDISRVHEYVQLYRETGHEVLAEPPVASEIDANCAACASCVESACRTIYVRLTMKARRHEEEWNSE